jgi:hypothetical protein
MTATYALLDVKISGERIARSIPCCADDDVVLLPLLWIGPLAGVERGIDGTGG